MSRSLAANNATESQAATSRIRLFAEFEWPGGTLDVWSGVGDITTLSRTFSGVGTFGGVSSVNEVESLSPQGCEFQLSGVPSALISTVLGTRFRGKDCALWIGFVDANGALVADPHQIYTGRLDQAIINDAGETASIQVKTENILADLDRPAVLRWSPADHKRDYPSDTGFDRVGAVVSETLLWPAPGSGGGSSGGGGGGSAGQVYVHGRWLP